MKDDLGQRLGTRTAQQTGDAMTMIQLKEERHFVANGFEGYEGQCTLVEDPTPERVEAALEWQERRK